MNVYAVIEQRFDNTLLGVFSTELKAEEFKAGLKAAGGSSYDKERQKNVFIETTALDPEGELNELG